MHTSLSRRGFVSSLAAGVLCANDGWVDLFNGRDFSGWQANENKSSWKVADGMLSGDGPRSHLFYNGPVRNADFRNFELTADVMTSPACNSGIYFHTAYQESDWPAKGFEVQVNNTATGEGNYRERKKTGSLYGVRNIYKQLARDNEWFTMNIVVRANNVQIRVNGTLVVDFVEPDPPVTAGNVHGRGTFALQCHDPGSKIRYRNIRVRPLPDDLPAQPSPAFDDLDRQILKLGAQNYPLIDLHGHLKSGLTVDQVLAHARRCGIQYGLAANCGRNFPIQNDQTLRQYIDSLRGQPVFVAMQAEGREWTQMFSASAASLADYIFTDSMTWTDNRGRRMRLWIPEEVGAIGDVQEFMNTLVDRTVGILENEPVDIYVNPTFLPDAIAKDYDTLWTKDRMKRVIDAAVRNSVAIELNNRYKIPSAAFIRMAKQNGAKFTMGTNNAGPSDLGRCEYSIRMIGECKLAWQDFFVPGAFGPKAVERKPGALKG